MKTNSPAERIALNPKHQRKPILYWQALRGGTDETNAIALLRHKWDKQVTFKAVR